MTTINSILDQIDDQFACQHDKRNLIGSTDQLKEMLTEELTKLIESAPESVDNKDDESTYGMDYFDERNYFKGANDAFSNIDDWKKRVLK